VPFNIASYALLTMMIAQVCNLKAFEFIHTFGDTHIYLNHLDQVKLQLAREPKPFPRIKLNQRVKNIDDFVFEDFELIDYNPYPAIKAPIAIKL
jgi:thymidylate synthase